MKSKNNVVMYVGGFCVVFPYKTPNKKYAVRCWFTNVTDAKERTRLIAEELHRIKLPYFVGFKYVENGLATNEGVQPIVLMDWVDASPLKEYINKNINNKDKLYRLAEEFKKMTDDLHKHSISHGDLQHGNILVSDMGEIILVDYDSMFVPALNGYSDEIKGLKGYQHPSRWDNDKLSCKADYFSELIIYTSIIAFAKMPMLWDDLHIIDTETMLFSAEDIKSGGASIIFNILSTDNELKKLSTAIKNALQKKSINELLPLEEAIIPPEEKISSEHKKKWANNGYVNPLPKYDVKTDTIKEKWMDNGYHQFAPTYDSQTDNIKNKW